MTVVGGDQPHDPHDPLADPHEGSPASGPQGAGPPPGWYLDPTGVSRWWDGQAWGMAAHELAPPVQAGAPGSPAAPYGPPRPNKTLAILSHLGVVLGGFILPLVIYLAADRNDAYVRHHASEGLNFSLSILVLQLGSFILFFGGFALTAASGSSGVFAGFGLFFLVWLLWLGVFVGALVFGIMAAVKASQGIWYRYPVTFRFVKGAAPEGTPPLVGL